MLSDLSLILKKKTTTTTGVNHLFNIRVRACFFSLFLFGEVWGYYFCLIKDLTLNDLYCLHFWAEVVEHFMTLVEIIGMHIQSNLDCPDLKYPDF